MLLNFRTFLTVSGFSLHMKFLVNYIFLYRLKNSLEAYLLWHNSYISTDLLNKHKQPFADVLQNRYSEKFRNNHRKTAVLESLLNKVTDWRPVALLNKDSNTGVSMWILKNFFKNSFLYKTPAVVASKESENKRKEHMIYFISWLTMNSKHIAKLQRYRSRVTNKQKHEQLKPRKTKT